MKSKLIALAMVFGIFLLILGWNRTYSYITTGKRLFERQVDNSMPFFVEIERAQGMVDSLDGAIWDYQEKLVGIRLDMDYLREEISTKEKQLAGERELLEEIARLLEQRREHYFINDKRYTYEEVNADGKARATIYRSQLEYLQTKKDNLRVMEDTAKLLEEEIALAQSKRQEFENLIAKLQAKHSQLEARKELAVLSDGVNIKKFRKNHFARISEILRRLEKQQEKAERLLDRLMGAKAQAGLIDYGKEPKSSGLEEIQSLLSENS